MIGHHNYGMVKRAMPAGPVCVISFFARGYDIKTIGRVEIVDWQPSQHVSASTFEA
jgi:hypothetical protein